MYLINFAHPLTDAQLERVRHLAGQPVERVIAVPAQFDHARPFAEQVRTLLAETGLTAEQWQTVPLVVNLPSLAPIAAMLLAELHGRCGYFPTIIRHRPVPDRVPPQFEVAELVDLQAIRDGARTRRLTS